MCSNQKGRQLSAFLLLEPPSGTSSFQRSSCSLGTLSPLGPSSTGSMTRTSQCSSLSGNRRNTALPGNAEPSGNVEHQLDDADEPVLAPPGYPETPHSPATPSPPGTSSPLGTSSTSSMVRTTLPSQPLTSEKIQVPARTRPLPVLSRFTSPAVTGLE